ncbi:unnamed protein product, partial [marine sediment metagenome]
MEIKLTTVIKQSDGIKPIINQENNLDLTLKDVCINALLTPLEGEDKKKKYPDYELWKKLRDVTKVDLKAEEIVRIKEKIEIIYPPLVMGQA